MKPDDQDANATRWDKITREQKRRDRAVIEPQRTGPNRLDLASLNDDHMRLGISYPEPCADFTINLRSISHLGLSLIERRAILAHIRDGIVPYNLHIELGCSRAEALAALNRGLRKLARSPESIAFTPLTNSLRLTFKERFRSGPPLWALNKLDSEFARIMRAEKNYYVSGQRVATNRRRVLPVVDENPTMAITLQKLKAAVDIAEKNHLRVGEHLHQVRVARDEADVRLQAAQYDLQKETAVAIHENRPPDVGPLHKKLAMARTEVGALDNALAAAKDALVLSEAAASEAKASMEANRKAAAIQAIASLRDEYLQGQLLQAKRLSKIIDVLGAHQMGSELILPEPADQWIPGQGLVLTSVEITAWKTRCAVMGADYQLWAATERWPELKQFVA